MIMPTLAETAVLFSIYKPILFGAIIGLWAYAVSYIDKDLDYFYMPRHMWNGINMAVGVLALFLWLVVPWFWLGLPLMVLMTVGGFVGYHFFRNKHVPPKARWRMSLDSFRQKWDEAQRARMQQRSSVAMVMPGGQPSVMPTGEDPRVPIHEALENLVEFALPRRAERIDMLADANETAISVTIDGVQYPQAKLEARLGLGLIDYLKEHAGLDVQDRRRKQVGKLDMVVADMGKQKIEITTSGTTKGLVLSAFINPHLRSYLKFNELGLLESQMQQITPSLEENCRGVLVVCPPRHGLTTTLLALVERHDPYTQNIMTLEPEIAHELEGVAHTAIKIGADAPTTGQQLKTLLLREPKIVMISQVTDAESAKQVTLHTDEVRFYMGLRQADAFTALRAWVSAVGDPETAAKSLNIIIAQRLIRKLCVTCRMPYKPDPNILRKLNLPIDKVQQLYKHSGKVMVKEEEETCPDCLGLGYRGRTGVFEVMVLDDQARQFIASGQVDHARSHLRKNRMLYLQESALTKVVEGVTSISEITRVLAADKPEKEDKPRKAKE